MSVAKKCCSYIFAAKLVYLKKKIKVGMVSYLNTRPMVYGLKLPPINNEIELVEDTPAQLAEMLQKGLIDVGLIPVAAIPFLEEYFIVGDYCIAAEGEVASVCLFSEVPMNEIEKVYLDYQSRSSVALLKWLMKEYWGIDPEIIQAQDESFRKEIKGSTAGLVIGDRALEQRKVSTYIYDLASEWRSITGLPFVFAVWVSTKKLPDEFIIKFNQANSVGFNYLDEIINDLNFNLYDLKKYYTLHIQYRLDERKRKGMELFLEYLKRNLELPIS
ncbi:MAG: menaquinone biosynthesis protein [Chitinophagaceae bacterium]|nr:menaquinone biosynthesis protein [Chitinophagaceae bacterium]